MTHIIWDLINIRSHIGGAIYYLYILIFGALSAPCAYISDFETRPRAPQNESEKRENRFKFFIHLWKVQKRKFDEWLIKWFLIWTAVIFRVATFDLFHVVSLCVAIFEPYSKFGGIITVLLLGVTIYKNSAYTVYISYSNQNSNVVESTTKKSKIVFLKTHKTGSSTIQNIFYRYGIGNVRNLTSHINGL